MMKRAKTVLYKVCMQALHFVIVLLGISFLTFSITFLSPQNPAELWLAGPGGNTGTISQEAIEKQEHEMGLDKPFLVQYGNWLGRALRGDLGTSITYHTPVAEEIASHAGPTAAMTAVSLLVSAGLSLPFGILCAVYKDRLFDHVMRVFGFFGISIPSFLLSILFLWFFCIRLGWFPVIAEGGIRGILLPSLVLILQFTGKMTRQIRAIILEQLEQPYVDGAITRGVKFSNILFGHVLKNSAASILTCIGIYVGLAFGGSAVIEGIFSVDGLGRLAVSSVARMDIYVLQGFVLWVALIYLIINLLVDILSALIDPRIRYNQKTGGSRL